MTLSIIVLSYNTKDLTRQCLQSLKKAQPEMDRHGYTVEVIVPDNGSTDGSAEMIKKEFPEHRLIINENIGFAKGNNSARRYCHGKYVLILNPDTVVPPETLPEAINYLEAHPEVGAMGCRIDLADGGVDRDARRSFPTPWVALTHLLKLDRLFPRSKIFAQYWYGYLPAEMEHEVDVLQGAFTLVRKKVLDEVGWYDEDYFLDGEDIDLCWKIKEKGWKIVYYPKVHILHYKGAAKGKKISKRARPLSCTQRHHIITVGVDSMEIFYRKRLWNRYPKILNLEFTLNPTKSEKSPSAPPPVDELINS